jgi:hypothetical protein
MCGHSADGAEWTYKTPRVVLMARSSKCETKGNLRAAFPNSLRPVTRGGPDVLPILHHASQLYQELGGRRALFASPRAAVLLRRSRIALGKVAVVVAFAVARWLTSIRSGI